MLLFVRKLGSIFAITKLLGVKSTILAIHSTLSGAFDITQKDKHQSLPVGTNHSTSRHPSTYKAIGLI